MRWITKKKTNVSSDISYQEVWTIDSFGKQALSSTKATQKVLNSLHGAVYLRQTVELDVKNTQMSAEWASGSTVSTEEFISHTRSAMC